jgi:hypothetical protein
MFLIEAGGATTKTRSSANDPSVYSELRNGVSSLPCEQGYLLRSPQKRIRNSRCAVASLLSMWAHMENAGCSVGGVPARLILLARSTTRAYGFVFGNSWTSDNPSRCFARWLETAFNPS